MLDAALSRPPRDIFQPSPQSLGEPDEQYETDETIGAGPQPTGP